MEKIKEGNRIRAKNYRERQKSLGIEKKRPKPKTRQKNLRTMRILSNKKARISQQKKICVKEKDCNRKMSKNKKRKTKSEKSNQIFSSPSAEEKNNTEGKTISPKKCRKNGQSNHEYYQHCITNETCSA